ncbi:hypothetical protein PaelaDRAFT_5782 [Paenibacillus lactis 154]|uniref:Uncharacterized protein n=1 Tax=Paenibacillus lactis 154 TaxID=743719 RepID=G4HP71_9BACL|nr:hypothetical protein PaelaDRAFT_5782 [Paenibacillus lactis 154]
MFRAIAHVKMVMRAQSFRLPTAGIPSGEDGIVLEKRMRSPLSSDFYRTLSSIREIRRQQRSEIRSGSEADLKSVSQRCAVLLCNASHTSLMTKFVKKISIDSTKISLNLAKCCSSLILLATSDV